VEDGIVRHYAFVREYRVLFKDNPSVLNVTQVSEEALLHLDCYINK
jgi:hypothetical protein